MWRFIGRWPALAIGVLCVGAAVGLTETSDARGIVVFLAAIGALLIGYAFGKGPDDG